MPGSRGRRSIRQSDYDYTQPGAYFVTICTFKRACLLGAVVDDNVRLGILGHPVAEAWRAIPGHFPSVDTDAFVIMPNHVHGIVLLVGAKHASPLRHPPKGSVVGSLSATVQSLKSSATRQANQWRGTPGEPLWQRGYYDHVIRTVGELNRLRRYIATNPLRWSLDKENPTRGLERR